MSSARCAGIGVILSGCVWIGGCASTLGYGEGEFKCKGYPEGARCMNVVDVYKATENADSVTSAPAKDEAEREGETNGPTPKANGRAAGKQGAGQAMANTATRTVIVAKVEKPVPIRMPAKVMRVWLAPWEDRNGNLIVSGYVFTEVVARKWSIGEQPMSESAVRVVPLQVEGKEAQTESRGGRMTADQ